MWFDVRSALARIETEKGQIAARATATPATPATRNPAPAAHVAEVAGVAGEHGQDPQAAVATGSGRATVPDAETYAAFLRDHGPATYGAAAADLGWGATRAWQAEARLRAAGRVRFDQLGKAWLVEGQQNPGGQVSSRDSGKTMP